MRVSIEDNLITVSAWIWEDYSKLESKIKSLIDEGWFPFNFLFFMGGFWTKVRMRRR